MSNLGIVVGVVRQFNPSEDVYEAMVLTPDGSIFEEGCTGIAISAQRAIGACLDANRESFPDLTDLPGLNCGTGSAQREVILGENFSRLNQSGNPLKVFVPTDTRLDDWIENGANANELKPYGSVTFPERDDGRFMET